MSSCRQNCSGQDPSSQSFSSSIWRDSQFLYLFTSLIFVGALELFSLFQYHFIWPLEWSLFGGVWVCFGISITRSGLKSLFRGDFANIQLLMTLAIIGALYLGHLPEAMIILVLYSLGEKLEDFGIAKSQGALRDLLERLPKQAEVKGEENPVPVENIPVGAVVIIRPGSQIPLDGVVVEGSSWVDESAITGEPVPKGKRMDSPVYGGTANTNGYLEIRVTKTSKDTTLAKIIDLTYRAVELKSTAQTRLEKFAAFYTPMVIVLALAVTIIPPLLLGASFGLWLTQGVSILLISCPCALVISTPVAIYSAIGNATQRGALIKGGKFLEEMGHIRAIGFDKTRTLTTGKLKVTDILELNGFSAQEVLACAAGMESQSEHPIAQSILEKAREEEVELHIFRNFETAPGKGITGDCTICLEPSHRLGTLSFVEGEEETAVADQIKALEKEGKTTLVMSENNKIKAIIALRDTTRQESREVIESLQQLGVEPLLLSGDSQIAAEEVGKKLSIQTVFGGLLPQEKQKEVSRILEEKGSMAMVGDGINDAPSLATASVGIAMGAVGSDIAIENAQIALMQDNLKLIPFLVKLARKTLNTISWNLFFAVGIKVIFLALALAGRSHIALAIFADVGVTVLVILNSLRLFSFGGEKPV